MGTKWFSTQSAVLMFLTKYCASLGFSTSTKAMNRNEYCHILLSMSRFFNVQLKWIFVCLQARTMQRVSSVIRYFNLSFITQNFESFRDQGNVGMRLDCSSNNFKMSHSPDHTNNCLHF